MTDATDLRKAIGGETDRTGTIIGKGITPDTASAENKRGRKASNEGSDASESAKKSRSESGNAKLKKLLNKLVSELFLI